MKSVFDRFVGELDYLTGVVWRASWQSAVLFGVVAILVLALGERIAPKWRFVLWALVLCRLAVVVTPPSPISGFNLVVSTPGSSAQAKSTVAAKHSPFAVVVTPEVKVNEFENAQNNGLDSDQKGNEPTETISDIEFSEVVSRRNTEPAIDSEINTVASELAWHERLAAWDPSKTNSVGIALWFVGFAGCVVYLIIAHFRLRRQLKECCLADDPEILSTFDSLCLELKLRQKPRLLITPRTTSPFTYGVLKPVVVFPEFALTELDSGETRCVLAHELAHICRRDVPLQWLALVVRAFYWFHPVAWLTAIQMQRSREGACDDLVLNHFRGSQTDYGRALLRLADELSAPSTATGACGLFGSLKPVQYRIRRISSFTTASPMSNAVAVLLVASLVVLGLTDAIPEGVAMAAEPQPQAETKVSEDETSRNEIQRNTSISANAAQDRTLTGRCVKALDGSAVAGARVVLFEVTGILDAVKKLAERTTDKQGQFEFTNLAPVSSQRFEKRQYATIAFVEGKPHSIGGLLYAHKGMDREQILRIYEGPVSMPGKVVDKDGVPIVGAIVQLSHALFAEDVGAVMATTNDKGHFLLNGVPTIGRDQGGMWRASLRIRHPRFKENFFQQQTHKFDTYILQDKGCVIRGRVVDSQTQKAIPNVIVSAIPFESGSATKAHTSTDANGNYKLSVTRGKYKVMLDDDMNRVAKAAEVLCRDESKVYEIKPFIAQDGGWVTGRIVNTKTGKPVVYSPTGDVGNLRVCVGLYGPNRPQGKINFTDFLAEVDDQGYFRMRAFPGENYPYVCNMTASRNTFTTMKQPPVLVEAGKEVTCDIPYTPALTPDEKMAIAHEVLAKIPMEPAARVEGIIEEFRKLNHTVDECETWCLLMKELVSIGKPAVPAICKELESTDQQRMMRRLAFALRAIGDPSAVPTLIRVIPKTLQPPMSDYGLMVEDADLTIFMQENSKSKDRGRHFSFGRPVNELQSALEKLTKRKFDKSELPSMSKSKDLRALSKQERLYYDAAAGWARWWEANWKQFGVDESLSKVNLPKYVARDVSAYPTGLTLTENAEVSEGTLGMVLKPVGDEAAGGAYFLDLDTKRSLKWPKELPAEDTSADNIKAASDWAKNRGADLMCVALPGVAASKRDSTLTNTLLGVDLQLWEIDPFDAKNIKEFVEKGELPKRRKLSQPYLLHFNAKADTKLSTIGSSFLYLTKDDGVGVITITDHVTEVRDITGAFSAPKGVGFRRGVRFDFKHIAR